MLVSALKKIKARGKQESGWAGVMDRILGGKEVKRWRDLGIGRILF